MSHSEASYISIGRITKTQGLNGAVRIEQILEEDAVFEKGRQVMLTGIRGIECATEIEFFRRQHGRCVAKFRGIDSISEAGEYVGSEIKIAANTLPVPEEGWFYTFQLRGCRVFGMDGEYLGTVTEVLGSGGTEILKVASQTTEILIPFAQPYMKKIDVAAGAIIVDLPEGLRDLNK